MYNAVALSILAAAGLGAAQSLAGIPTCATGCVTNAIPANCNLDPKCICESTSFLADVACCISTACDQAGQEAALAYAKTICTPVGVTDLPQSATCAAGASGASSTASDASSSGSAAASSTASDASISASASASDASESASDVAASATSAAGASASAATESAGSAVASATAGGGAEGLVRQGWGVVGAGVLGVAALL